MSNFLLWWGLPFFAAIVLPAFLIPQFVALFFRRNEHSLPSFLPYTLTLIIGAVFANIFWQFGLVNRIYYEWDRIIIPYTFFGAETPILDGSSSWILKGWTVGHLEFLWFLITISIYIAGVLISLFIYRTHKQFRRYRKALLTSSFILLLLNKITLLLAVVLTIVFFQKIGLTAPKENNISCGQSIGYSRILYSAGNYWISDMSGQDLKELDRFGFSTSEVKDMLSPNGTMLAYDEGNAIKIRCLNTKGYYSIELPEHSLKGNGRTNYDNYTSDVSWSPDSTSVVVNHAGNLVKVNVITKEVTTLKEQVALRRSPVIQKFDDKVNNKNEARYEMGSAIWTANNQIFYTAFGDEDKTEIHQLDVTSQQDQVIKSSENKISLISVNVDGSVMYLSELNQDKQGSRLYLFDIKAKKEIPRKTDKTSRYLNLDWTADPNIYVLHQGTIFQYGSSVTTIAPILVVNYKEDSVVNLSDALTTLLKEKGIETGGYNIGVDVNDVHGQDLLLTLAFHRPNEDKQHFRGSRQINAILKADKSLVILQDYSEQDLYQDPRDSTVNDISPAAFVGY